jgi:uncharacterized membrane protein
MLLRVSRFAATLILSVGFLPAILFAAPAAASFSVCNKTEHGVLVAIGFFDGKNWRSAGWWPVTARDCAELIKTPLVGRYYYLYASHEEVGGAWDGDRSFCVTTGRFTIRGRGDCQHQGYEVKRFLQVDTGNSPNWTENLAD